MSDIRAVGVYSPPLRLTGRLLDAWTPPATSTRDEELLAAPGRRRARRAPRRERTQAQADLRAPASGTAR